MRNFCSSLLTVATSLTLAASAHAAPLPGGAGSLVETYEDWVVACQAQGDTTACVMRQVQTNNQTGQHLLSAEFRNTAGGNIEGALIMPFGLALAQGATLKIDEVAPGPALAFSTCLPQGCVAPVNLDAAMVDTLKEGTTLDIGATGLNPPQPVPFKVSLKGFSAALDRMTELTK